MTAELILIIGIVIIIFLGILVSCIRIVPQSKAWVMERIGVYSKTWHTGIHMKIPFIEKAAKKVDLREQILVCGDDFNHSHYHKHAAYNSERFRVRSTEEKDSTNQAQAAAGVVGATANVVAAVAGATQTQVSSKKKEEPYYSLYSYDVHATPYDRAHNPKSQPVITKDNVSMEIDTVVFYQVTDPKLYAYGHANPIKAIEHLTATTLRNIVGGLELDETLTSRDVINDKLRKILDEATDAWGIRVTRVELKNIIISDVELAEAMEKQMIAERTKRAEILLAEGESHSRILKAEAEKKAEILVAEGKAEHIRLVNEAAPSQEFLTIRALEAFETAAQGESNTIIVPSELQNLAGLAKSASEVFKA